MWLLLWLVLTLSLAICFLFASSFLCSLYLFFYLFWDYSSLLIIILDLLCWFISYSFCYFTHWFKIYTQSWTPLPPPSAYHPSGSSQCTRPKDPVSNLDWWFVSYMILYMFQCHSPKSSHPRPLPQSPKNCSIHLCLFRCLAYRVIITIFLNSVYTL